MEKRKKVSLCLRPVELKPDSSKIQRKKEEQTLLERWLYGPTGNIVIEYMVIEYTMIEYMIIDKIVMEYTIIEHTLLEYTVTNYNVMLCGNTVYHGCKLYAK